VLADVIEFLTCPNCGEPLRIEETAARCSSGHTFDVARQGYVSLLPGRAKTGTADTAEMVDARDAFLGGGWFAPIASAVASAVKLACEQADGCVVDAGAGTGYYLAHAIGGLDDRAGLALDLSKYASRRAARAGDLVGAAVCDTWGAIPVRTGVAAAVLDVFSPRNAAEFRRMLAPEGRLIVVTPTARHLAEIVGALGLLDVDERKHERLDATFGELFEMESRTLVEDSMALPHSAVEQVVAMGPSGMHADSGLPERIAALDDPAEVTLSVELTVYRPKPAG